MSALAILLMLTAAPARADLAGACAYAGVSSDCLNKPQWTSQVPTYKEREPVCDAECRRKNAEWEQRVLDAIPEGIDTKPLEPDPEEETVWHFAHVGEKDVDTEVFLAGAAFVVVGLATSETWAPVAAMALLYLGTRSETYRAATAAMDDLRRVRARTRNNVQECKDAVAASDLFCSKNSCKKGLGDTDPCNEARLRLIKSRVCLAARENMRDICHGGVDDKDHAEAVGNARNAIDTCEGKVGVHCSCDPKDRDVLAASVGKMCASAGDCPSAGDCARTLAALTALRFCRFAVKGLALRCAEVAGDLAGLERQESDCRQSLVSRCAEHAR